MVASIHQIQYVNFNLLTVFLKTWNPLHISFFVLKIRHGLTRLILFFFVFNSKRNFITESNKIATIIVRSHWTAVGNRSPLDAIAVLMHKLSSWCFLKTTWPRPLPQRKYHKFFLSSQHRSFQLQSQITVSFVRNSYFLYN